MSPGTFVVIEGIDGCGSTTQCHRLVATLKERGVDARATFEPSNGPIGQLIRAALESRLEGGAEDSPRKLGWSTLALLFAADRVEHLDSQVNPALAEGALVVSDRYDLSSLAYQSLTSPEGSSSVAWIRELNSRARRPDLTIVIDVSAELAEERRRSRGGPEELFEKSELQRRLVGLYDQAESIVPGDRLVHVSGAGNANAVAARVLDVLRRELPELLAQ